MIANEHKDCPDCGSCIDYGYEKCPFCDCEFNYIDR